MIRITFVAAILVVSASCVAELDDNDESINDPAADPADPADPTAEDTTPYAGTAKPGDVVCDGTLCWDQEWHACGGYNYRARVYLSRSSGQYRPYYSSVTQYTGDRNRTVNGLDWQVWLRNDNGLLGASTYHDDDNGNFGYLPLYNFDPRRDTRPYVEFLAGKSQDGEGSCRFRVYLYGPG